MTATNESAPASRCNGSEGNDSTPTSKKEFVMTTISHSFPGTHPYNEECAAAAVQLDWIDVPNMEFTLEELTRLGRHHATRVTAELNAGRCPRCSGPISPDRNAGSRITTCRCIPICPRCGEDEAFPLGLARRIWEWPTSKSAITRRLNKAREGAEITTAIVTGNTMITETGATEIKGRPHPGGWAEYGHDGEVAR